MRFMVYAAILLLLECVSKPNASAEPTAQELPLQALMVGMGREACSQWTAHPPAGQKHPGDETAWLNGFISAKNLYDKTPGRHWFLNYDGPVIARNIDRFCEKHPDRPIAEAVLAFFKEFDPGKP